MIESAYRERLANRRLREQDLRELHADLVTTAVSLTVNGSVVAVARTENPLPAIPRVWISRRLPQSSTERGTRRGIPTFTLWSQRIMC